MKYLRIFADGCHPSCGLTLYTPLDPLTEYTEADLDSIAQDVFNEHYGNWSQFIVDEEDVPEEER